MAPIKVIALSTVVLPLLVMCSSIPNYPVFIVLIVLLQSAAGLKSEVHRCVRCRSTELYEVVTVYRMKIRNTVLKNCTSTSYNNRNWPNSNSLETRVVTAITAMTTRQFNDGNGKQ